MATSCESITFHHGFNSTHNSLPSNFLLHIHLINRCVLEFNVQNKKGSSQIYIFKSVRRDLG